MRLLLSRNICNYYCLVSTLILLLLTEICSISTTSMPDSYDSNTTLWHNLYRHKNIDCDNLHWLHPAKTSSSFGIPLQHVCCPEVFENITSGVTIEMLEENLSLQATHNKSYHTSFRYVSHNRLQTFERDGYPSLREHCNSSFIQRSTGHNALPITSNLHLINVVTMLREPKARMISAFLYGIHNAGGFETNSSAYEQLRQMIGEIALNSSLTKNEQLLQQAQMYANSPFIYGYQLRLIIGLLNADLSEVNDDLHMPLVHRAIHRLRDFFFVGIFEEYNKSIKVLHALSKVNTTPTVVENFLITHSTNHEQAAYLHKHVVFNDRYDNLVYEAAKKIFTEEIEFIQSTYNIT